MIRNLFSSGTLTAIAVLLFGSTLSAQGQESRLLVLARDSAIVAGGARFCKFDPDTVEEFIAKSEARLSLFASDEYEKVLARLEFKNILDAYSVREPDGGCAGFRSVFEQSRKNIQ